MGFLSPGVGEGGQVPWGRGWRAVLVLLVTPRLRVGFSGAGWIHRPPKEIASKLNGCTTPVHSGPFLATFCFCVAALSSADSFPNFLRSGSGANLREPLAVLAGRKLLMCFFKGVFFGVLGHEEQRKENLPSKPQVPGCCLCSPMVSLFPVSKNQAALGCHGFESPAPWRGACTSAF